MGPTIRLIGRPEIRDGQGVAQPVRGHQPWAVLVRVLLSDHSVDRRRLAAELFPDTDDPLGALRWCLAALRRALGSADVLTGDPVAADLPPGCRVDVLDLERETFEGELAGNLLDGVEPRCSPEFATWLLVERERIGSRIDARIRQEVLRAMAVGDHPRAIRFAELAVRRQPFDEGAHVLLVRSLAVGGRHDAACAHVHATEEAFRAELGEAPSPALRSAARRTVAEAPAGVAPAAVAQSLLDAGLAALAAGVADAGLDCLRRAVAAAESGGDRQLQARTLLELGTALVHSVRGYDDEGAILLRQAVAQAEPCGDALTAAAGLRELGYVDALAGRRPAAAAHLARALDVAADSDSLAGIHAVSGFNLVDWGQIDSGLDHYLQSLEHARRAGNRRREAWSLGLGAWGLVAADRLDEADAWLALCLEIVAELRWVAFRPWPVAVRAESALARGGDPDSLLAELEPAFALSCQLGDPCWEGATARVLALCHAAAGDLDKALAWIEQAQSKCIRETDAYVALRGAILADNVMLNARVGDTARADALARELVSLAARAHLDLRLNWAINRIGSGLGSAELRRGGEARHANQLS